MEDSTGNLYRIIIAYPFVAVPIGDCDGANTNQLNNKFMAKANLKLPNGTNVNINGSAEEIQKILNLYSNGNNLIKPGDKNKSAQSGEKITEYSPTSRKEVSGYLTKIVNLIKDCEEAENIEKNILDRASAINRVLLPLYIVNKHLDNKIGMQSGDISKITKQLGTPISQPNASTILSGSASRYVMGDKTRKHGQPVKYKLNRRGLQYIKNVITGKSDV